MQIDQCVDTDTNTQTYMDITLKIEIYRYKSVKAYVLVVSNTYRDSDTYIATDTFIDKFIYIIEDSEIDTDRCLYIYTHTYKDIRYIYRCIY